MRSSKLTYDAMLVEMQNYNYVTVLITVNNNSMAARVTDDHDISVLIKKVLDLEELQADIPSTKEIKEVLGKFQLFDGTDKVHLQTLVDNMKKSYTEMLNSVKRRKSVSAKLSKLYSLFHQFATNEGYLLCCSCEKALGLKVPEVLWQLLLENVFKIFLTVTLAPVSDTVVSTGDQSNPRILSAIEENAIRYTAECIISKLEKKYCKRKPKEDTECAAALKDMGTKLHQRVAESEDMSTKWTNLINRGGLLLVKNDVYDLFLAIESLVEERLSQIFMQGGAGIEQVKMENLSWICDNEDVQHAWNLINLSAIEEECVRDNLLLDIAQIWVTTRGHSKTHMIKEDYKRRQQQSVKGTRSLRKELESN